MVRSATNHDNSILMSSPTTTTTDGPILVMTAGGANPQVMINALSARWPGRIQVIEEQPESKGTILKRRARRLGWLTALGQLGTMIASRLTKQVAARRSAEIIAEYGASSTPDAAIPVTRVPSLNHASCHEAVARLAPSAIFTISCRILSAKTLAAMPCPVINFHAGINPGYRGQMGGYWALVEGDAAHFGGTVHLVDAGIDTGDTLYQQRVTPARTDTIATYPLLLTAAGTQIAIQALEDVFAGRLDPYQPAGRSALRYPPPIWTWIYYGLTKRIW
jgi:hypothetical protein